MLVLATDKAASCSPFTRRPPAAIRSYRRIIENYTNITASTVSTAAAVSITWVRPLPPRGTPIGQDRHWNVLTTEADRSLRARQLMEVQ